MLKYLFIFLVALTVVSCGKNELPPISQIEEQEVEEMIEEEEVIPEFFCDSITNLECFALEVDDIEFATNIVLHSLMSSNQNELLFFDEDVSSLILMDESFGLINRIGYPHLNGHFVKKIIINSDGDFIVLSSRFQQVTTITKIDKAGNLIWAQDYESGPEEQYDSISEMNSKGYLVVGVKKELGFKSKILITDQEGIVISSNEFESDESDFLEDVINFKDGHVLIGGTANVIVGFDRELFYYTYNDASGFSDRIQIGYQSGWWKKVINTDDGGFAILSLIKFDDIPFGQIQVFKFDSDENLEWRKLYGGLGGELPVSMISSKMGGFYILGVTYSNGYGASEIYLLKIDSEGEIEWHKTYGTPNRNFPFTILELENEEIIIGGETGDDLDVFFLRLDNRGIPKS